MLICGREPVWSDGGGDGRLFSALANWLCTFRASSIKVPMKTLVKPFMVVITEGGTDCDKVWLVI